MHITWIICHCWRPRLNLIYESTWFVRLNQRSSVCVTYSLLNETSGNKLLCLLGVGETEGSSWGAAVKSKAWLQIVECCCHRVESKYIYILRRELNKDSRISAYIYILFFIIKKIIYCVNRPRKKEHQRLISNLARRESIPETPTSGAPGPNSIGPVQLPCLYEPHLNPDESNPLYCLMFNLNYAKVSELGASLQVFLSAIHVTCSTHPILLDVISLVIVIEEYRLWIFSLLSFLHLPATTIPSAPDFLLTRQVSLQPFVRIIYCSTGWLPAVDAILSLLIWAVGSRFGQNRGLQGITFHKAVNFTVTTVKTWTFTQIMRHQ